MKSEKLIRCASPLSCGEGSGVRPTRKKMAPHPSDHQRNIFFTENICKFFNKNETICIDNQYNVMIKCKHFFLSKHFVHKQFF